MSALSKPQPATGNKPSAWCGQWTKALLFVSAAFAPWAFGTTQPWSIFILNLIGSALGLLWLLRPFFRNTPGNPDSIRPAHWTTLTLGGLTALILVYSLIAAVNARSTFAVTSRAFQPLSHIAWLPHSYDRTAGWLACWQTFALAGTFWAARAWLLAERRIRPDDTQVQHSGLLPSRTRRLLFFIVSNGFLLAVIALLQRLDNSGKLLWLVQPRINEFADEQFGPFAYRSNGLQYLGLIWPVGFGLWSMRSHAQHSDALLGTGRRGWLLLCALLMAACPLLWESRVAVVINLAAVTVVTTVLLISHQATKRRVLLTCGIVLALGISMTLNWRGLAERFSTSGMQSVERAELVRAGGEMFRDHWLFGTGPGTFPALYHLYRPSEHSVWQTHLHCDWLQALATWGVMGFTLLAAALVVLLLTPLDPNKLPARKSFILLFNVGIFSVLLHALVDFPFQIYSIQHLFVLLAACYSTLSVKD